MNAYSGNEKYIFISFAHKDKVVVFNFISKLSEFCNIWYDEGITPGTEWVDNIIHNLENSSLFLFMATNNSVHSENCKDEIAFARDHHLPFIIICLEPVKFDESFIFRYGRFQMFNAYEYVNFDIAINNLLRKAGDLFPLKSDLQNELKESSENIVSLCELRVPYSDYSDIVDFIREKKFLSAESLVNARLKGDSADGYLYLLALLIQTKSKQFTDLFSYDRDITNYSNFKNAIKYLLDEDTRKMLNTLLKGGK